MTADNPGHSRPPELADTTVHHRDGDRWITCFCAKTLRWSIIPHMKKDHAEKWAEWTCLFVRLRTEWYSLKQIMRAFSADNGNILFSWTVIERAVRERVEDALHACPDQSKRGGTRTARP